MNLESLKLITNKVPDFFLPKVAVITSLPLKHQENQLEPVIRNTNPVFNDDFGSLIIVHCESLKWFSVFYAFQTFHTDGHAY